MGSRALQVVKGLDVERYMGRWYEIASMPSRFQPKSGVNTRATYTLNPDNTIHVLNETWTDGKTSSIEGTAFKVDPHSEEAKLKVKFYVPPFLPLFPVVGDYWVMALDADYRWAMVGQPSRKYLWILSREAELDPEIYNQLVEKAKEEGYNVELLQRTKHTEIPQQETGKDNKGVWWLKALFGK